MDTLNLVLALLCVLMSVGCNSDRYELQKDKQGNTVRLDKETGEVLVISGSIMHRVKSPEEQQRHFDSVRAVDERLKSPITWPRQFYQSLGNVTINVRTIWRDGELKYDLTMNPMPIEVQKATSLYGGGKYTLRFLDSNLFKLLEIDFWGGQCVRLVDNSGRATSNSYEGGITCSRELYQDIASWSLLYY